MKKFWAWLLLSSKDPQKASLTIKSIGMGVATYVLFFTGLLHLNVSQSDFATLVNDVSNIIGALLMLVSIIAGTVGFIRKLLTTMTGKNQVINTGATL